MFRKLISVLVFEAIAVGLPLFGRPDLWLDWRVLTVAFSVALLLLTQPAIASREATSRDDRQTMWLILGLGLLSVAAPLTEFAWFGGSERAGFWPFFGLFWMISGIALRLWAIATLGRWFTAEVRVEADQPLIAHGPYRWLRHPSYSGAYLAFLGTAVLLAAPIGFLIAAGGMFWAYRNRIEAEETALFRHFGAKWAAFAGGRRRLVPFFW